MSNGGFTVFGDGCFICGTDVVRSCFGKDLAGLGDLLLIQRVNSNKIAAGLELFFINFCFNLRDAEADQTANNPSSGRTEGRATECGHYRTCREECPYTWDGKCTDAC